MARVLVVDDDADIRSVVRISLELDGHEVTEAANGIEALQAVGPGAPDVMVLDLAMPHLDGWEVLGRLKAGAGDDAGLPVLVLTARVGEHDRIRGGVEGAVRYLTKPFDPDVLRKEVQQALEAPEPELRRRAAIEALERMAALERGVPADALRAPAARPRVARLGGPVAAPSAPVSLRRFGPDELRALSPRQRELLRAVADTPTVLAAAERLGVSRSNVYASMRRIARRLKVASVSDLVTLARQGVSDDGAA
ncbi:MAG TPA: response regulator [Acidimicrobiales bacterium]|nr:response regulator [Acidimicrobiales bacterium]